MPEIAECYSIAKQIKKLVPNTVSKIVITDKFDHYLGDADQVLLLKNVKFTNVFAYGKSIWFQWHSAREQGFFISQLGMTGAWFINKEHNRAEKHNHLVFEFKDKQKLLYSDPRMFGNTHVYRIKKNQMIEDLRKEIIIKHKWGIDPLQSNNVEVVTSMAKWQKSAKSIKDLMLNQNIIFGIGNYLASEVLAASSISPFRLGNKLSDNDLNTVADNLRKVITKALKYNGYSFAKGYFLPDGTLGQFTDVVKVYEHEGDICPYCNNGNIKKDFLSGRSTYFCSKCQV